MITKRTFLKVYKETFRILSLSTFKSHYVIVFKKYHRQGFD